ncbi:PR-1-like protein [Anaeromyces robustus]|uniref:PR-1-like protein n=1 Tax=Anaeromyces robustus TaxID=1754192 RepID=A0A1Y1WNY9_9FUNG|nr:PR-1-like protein [Anaeromyces robustus]|eukprot:ORX75261.1 PR-1-like protein [Anaeromyces robustus]
MNLNLSSIIAIIIFACIGVQADLTKNEKKTLLTLHNKARSDVHAPNMQTLSWDDKMAASAQEYANECKGMVHSGAGPENLAANTWGNITSIFYQWMEEKEAFDKSGYRAKLINISYNGEAVGHYSQIVWASNTKLGCGYTICPNLSINHLLVCRYGTGNIIGYEVYGEPDLSIINDPDLNSNDATGMKFNRILNCLIFVTILLILL